ncbi:HTH-type transcriptional activator IlvY [Desulfotalea psychrophila]|uniref:Probable transcriptional activator protein (IlvY) n=1 Tax=Desulfotalea psychrophila (strain LSv54 / DSM 12343) TaxID=177439 RepID=Q6AQB9_DESPS|nr:HTH-type transcriptional activator IlvY [Desulfotalea psychrophila]CAG35454.1 probable transcriptional activator protein (IlvY) [Desulfotalea psychrophila LSv54]
MNIRELKLFRHLSHSLHFGKTSRECHITPSGLTRTIQRLEGEIGQPLFQRDNRSVQLTAAGFTFCSYCDETIERWNDLQNHLTGQTSLKGEISLYCSVTAVLSILPTIFRRFKNEHPEVRIRIETGDAAEAQQKINAKEADISIIALPDKQPENLKFIEFLQTPLIFILPNQFTEAIIVGEEGIDWQKTPIIMPNRGLSRQRTDKWFAEKNIHPNIYSQVAGNEAIIAMVSMGCGAGVVPQLVMEKSPLASQVTVTEVYPRLTPFSVGACVTTKKLKEPIVDAFWQVASLYRQNMPLSYGWGN